MGPKCRHRCLYERGKRDPHRGVEHMNTDTETGVMLPQPRNTGSYEKLAEARNGIFSRASGGSEVWLTPLF
jgi:hypothetical protein